MPNPIKRMPPIYTGVSSQGVSSQGASLMLWASCRNCISGTMSRLRGSHLPWRTSCKGHL